MTPEGWATLEPVPGRRQWRRTDRQHYFLRGRSLCGRRYLEEPGYYKPADFSLSRNSRDSLMACAKCYELARRRRLPS